MRVLHLLPPAAGGMLRHVRCLATGLAEVESFCAAVPGAGCEALADVLPGRCIGMPFPDRATLPAILGAALVARRAARRLRPDLIHGHGYRGMLVAGLASRLAWVPFAFTAHNLPEELGPGFWRRARPLARRARGAVCVSRAIRDGLAERLGPGTARGPLLRVVYNGIEPGPPPGPRLPLPADLHDLTFRRAVLTAARLAPQKGIGTLLEAWALLSPRSPGAVLLIAGDGPLRPKLEVQATALGIAESVRFLGFRDDVAGLLSASHLAVIPSLVEGQSIFALEAMARGVPVVATRVGGIPEVVRDGETGLLADAGDPALLAGAMRRVLEDEALASRVAAAGRALVERQLTLECMLAGYRGFYAELGLRKG